MYVMYFNHDMHNTLSTHRELFEQKQRVLRIQNQIRIVLRYIYTRFCVLSKCYNVLTRQRGIVNQTLGSK